MTLIFYYTSTFFIVAGLVFVIVVVVILYEVIISSFCIASHDSENLCINHEEGLKGSEKIVLKIYYCLI
jgi:hypothetical protein